MSGNCPHRVIEIYTGPRGIQGIQGIQGTGPSLPFTFISGSTWATTSSIVITGSLTVSGSNTFRNIGTGIFSGSLLVSGSSVFTGSVQGDFTGSLFGTASYASQALTASHLLNAVPPFPYTGSAEITGSLGVTGSFKVGNSFINVSSSGKIGFGQLPDPTYNYAFASTIKLAGGQAVLSQYYADNTNSYSGMNRFTGRWEYGTNANLKIYDTGVTNITGSAIISGSLNTTGSVEVKGILKIFTGTGTGNIVTGEYFTNLSAIWLTQTSPNGSNYAIAGIDGANTLINGATTVNIRVGGSDAFNVTSTLITYKDAINLAFNTSTGTKIGTAISQKIGFWNATPITQSVSGSSINELLANTGLIQSGSGPSRITNGLNVTNNTTAFDDYVGAVTGNKTLRVWNSTTSTTSQTNIYVQNNGAVVVGCAITSGTYTGAGLYTSNTAFIGAQNGTTRTLIGNNNVASDIIFVNGGLTTSQESFRITSLNIQIAEGNNIITGINTGTKFGTSGLQKLSFWNATPTTQSSTSITSSILSILSGSNISDATTFGGYTMGQVVQALKSVGLLA